MEKIYTIKSFDKNKLIVNCDNSFGYHFSINIDTLSEFLESAYKLKSNYIGLHIDYFHYSDCTEFDAIEMIPLYVEYESDDAFNKRVKAYNDKIENDKKESEKRKEKNEIELLKKLKQKYPSV